MDDFMVIDLFMQEETISTLNNVVGVVEEIFNKIVTAYNDMIRKNLNITMSTGITVRDFFKKLFQVSMIMNIKIISGCLEQQ